MSNLHILTAKYETGEWFIYHNDNPMPIRFATEIRLKIENFENKEKRVKQLLQKSNKKLSLIVSKTYTIPDTIMEMIEDDFNVYTQLSIEEINQRIQREYCHETLEELTDSNLMCEYKNCNSVNNEIKKLGDVLDKYTDENTKQKIIQDYLLQLIPPGTKGVIRGNKFNNIVKQFITNLCLDTTRFEICFEKKCEQHFTTEIPDWYILDKSSNKIIIGMNQLDLWGGGQQLNRGSKYIENNKHNTENSKLLCVVCNKIQFTSSKNKAYKLFEFGFKNNTLCYLNNLKNIITSYFTI